MSKKIFATLPTTPMLLHWHFPDNRSWLVFSSVPVNYFRLTKLCPFSLFDRDRHILPLLCRWLSFVTGYFAYRHAGRFIGNRYGAGRGRIWLDNVRCSGTETDITACQHGGWGRHSCTHDDDVSVSCVAGRPTNCTRFTVWCVTA